MGAHEERDQSRKDDLESLLYVFLDLYTGKLPWAEHVRVLEVEMMGRGGGGGSSPLPDPKHACTLMWFRRG